MSWWCTGTSIESVFPSKHLAAHNIKAISSYCVWNQMLFTILSLKAHKYCMVSLILPFKDGSSCLHVWLETMPALCSQVERGNRKWTQQKRRLPRGERLSVSDCLAGFSMSASAPFRRAEVKSHLARIPTNENSAGIGLLEFPTACYWHFKRFF